MPRTATPVSLSRSAMTGPSVWPSYGLPCRALACSTNCPPLGAVAGVAIVAAELVGARALGRATNRPSARADAALDGAHATPDRAAGRSGLRALCCPRSCDVTDDAPERGGQELQLPPGTLELMGMRITPDHDGGALGHPQIALVQLDTLAFWPDRPASRSRGG